MNNQRTKKIVFTALFAALAFVATYVIVIPLPLGYFNAGDIIAILSGWLLGPIYGAIAAAIGGALADVLSGYVLYAPATLCIKACVAILAYFLFKILHKRLKKKYVFLSFGVSALVAESVMVLGYFLFDGVLYAFATAALSLLGNGMQGDLCAICATLLGVALDSIPFVKRTFSSMFSSDKF